MSQVQLTKSHQSLKEENIKLIINERGRQQRSGLLCLVSTGGAKEKYLTSTIKTENGQECEAAGCTRRLSWEGLLGLKT